MLVWWNKVLAIEEDRLPKICLNPLIALADVGDTKYNWHLQLKQKLRVNGVDSFLFKMKKEFK